MNPLKSRRLCYSVFRDHFRIFDTLFTNSWTILLYPDSKGAPSIAATPRGYRCFTAQMVCSFAGLALFSPQSQYLLLICLFKINSELRAFNLHGQLINQQSTRMFKQHFLYHPSFLLPKLDSPLISSGFRSKAATPHHQCTLQIMFGRWCWSCRTSSSGNQLVLTDFSTAPPLPCYHGAINTHYSAGQLDFFFNLSQDSSPLI